MVLGAGIMFHGSGGLGLGKDGCRWGGGEVLEISDFSSLAKRILVLS